MNGEKKLINKINSLRVKPGDEVPAFLGNLAGTVKADKFSNVYVVFWDGTVETVKNNVVPSIPRLPVMVGYRGNSPVLEVLRLRDAYDNQPWVNVADHAERTHGEFQADPVRVTAGQILPGLAFPIAGTLKVFLFGREYYLKGWHVLPNRTLDFTDEVPVTDVARMALVEIDEYGVITYRAGSDKASKNLLTREDIPAVSTTKVPLFAVQLYYGQTEIRKEKNYSDIVDLRFAGVAGGGIASSILWDDILSKPTTFEPTQETWDAIYGIGEGHTHASWRWAGDGSADTFDLPDFAEKIIAAYDHALRVDPSEVDLSDDGSQVVFSAAPADGHVVSVDYVMARL